MRHISSGSKAESAHSLPGNRFV